MGEPRIASFPIHKTRISGESLVVQTLFDNASDAPWTVPSTDAPSPLRYELVPEGEGKRLVLSNDDFITLLRNEPPDRREPPELHTLAPGKRLVRWEEVAELSPEPLPPGQYQLISHYRDADTPRSSLPTRLELVRARLESSASAYCLLRGNLVSTFTHRASDGRAIVLMRESYRERPALGIFRRIAELDGETRVRDICVFVDSAPIVGGRWMAWVRGGRLSARNVWGERVQHVLDGFGPDWSGLRLAGNGFQLGDATGVMLVTGEDGGRSHVAALRLREGGAEVLWKAPLPGTPEKLGTSYDSEGRLWLSWTSAGHIHTLAGGTREGSLPGEARVLGRLEASLAAWSIPTLCGGASPRVVILEGPTEQGTLRRRVLSAGVEASAPQELGPLPDGATHFGLLEREERVPILLAAKGEHLLFATARGPLVWKTLGRLDREAPSIQAYATERGEAWAEWNDPELGPQRMRLDR